MRHCLKANVLYFCDLPYPGDDDEMLVSLFEHRVLKQENVEQMKALLGNVPYNRQGVTSLIVLLALSKERKEERTMSLIAPVAKYEKLSFSAIVGNTAEVKRMERLKGKDCYTVQCHILIGKG